MTPEIRQQLETMLETQIPEWYLDFLQNYPQSLKTACRALDESNAEGFVRDVELCEDPADILFLNQEAREDWVPTPDHAELYWPPQMLIVGETGFGDYYCIDAMEEVQGIVQYNHQDVTFEQITDDLQEFVIILEDTFCDAATDDHSH